MMHAERPPQSTAALTAARPVTFAGTVGLFCAARSAVPRDTAVLFVGPWGLEEMCLRRFSRILGDRLADDGIASLRFDYPGTGDALDGQDFSGGLALWTDSVVQAAALLRRLSGCGRVVVLAQGLGVSLACLAASRLGSLAGAVLLAPVVSGRAYLRELQVWSRLIDEGLGLGEAAAETVSIAGLEMPRQVAAGLKSVDLRRVEGFSAEKLLIGCRDDRPNDAAFADHLAGLGLAVERFSYAGYQAFVSNPATSQIPDGLVERLAAWVGSIARNGGSLLVAPAIDMPAATQRGEGFRETAVTFGESGRLYGMLCEPEGPRAGATAILLGTAYDRHAGWARSTVAIARGLARSGIATLRFDAADVGDSPAPAGFSGNVLYDDVQLLDVEAAIDFIENRGLGPTIVSGRCSGAYLAFRSAVTSRRLRGAVAANPYDFYWQPGRNVDEALRNTARSLGDYRARFFRRETLRRLLAGDIDVASAAGNVVGAVSRKALGTLSPLKAVLSGRGNAHDAVMTAFRQLAERGIRLTLLYSANDIGYEHFAGHFGADGRKLQRFANVSYRIVAGADHNFTPVAARRAYLVAVQDMALSARAELAEEEPRPAERRARAWRSAGRR